MAKMLQSNCSQLIKQVSTKTKVHDQKGGLIVCNKHVFTKVKLHGQKFAG